MSKKLLWITPVFASLVLPALAWASSVQAPEIKKTSFIVWGRIGVENDGFCGIHSRQRDEEKAIAGPYHETKASCRAKIARRMAEKKIAGNSCSIDAVQAFSSLQQDEEVRRILRLIDEEPFYSDLEVSIHLNFDPSGNHRDEVSGLLTSRGRRINRHSIKTAPGKECQTVRVMDGIKTDLRAIEANIQELRRQREEQRAAEELLKSMTVLSGRILNSATASPGSNIAGQSIADQMEKALSGATSAPADSAQSRKTD